MLRGKKLGRWLNGGKEGAENGEEEGGRTEGGRSGGWVGWRERERERQMHKLYTIKRAADISGVLS